MAGGRRSHGQGTFWGDLIGPNPTDRGKAGTKRSLLVDGEGGPLSIVVAGANVHDAKLLEATLDAIVVERPQPTEEEPQHLCLDKGYDNPSGRGAAAGHGYREHIRRIGEEKLDASGDKRYPARRWVVERTLAWLSKCRAVLVRYDKKAANYLGVLQLACALLWFRLPTVASGHFEIVTKWSTLDAIVVERPQPTEEEPQHLCLDKGYDNPSGRGAAAGHGYREHIRRIGEEKLDASGDKRYPARRWVVERTLAWLSKCRAVLVRYDKKAANYLGVLQLACALLWFRRQWRLAILR